MVVFGTSLFGKVDGVPGVFHVATRFIHVFFIPFVPTASWLIFEKRPTGPVVIGDWYGVQLTSIHWRSVFMAWARIGLGTFAAILAVMAATMIALDAPIWKSGASVLVALGCAAGLVLSYRLTRATRERIDVLSQTPGIPQELIERAKQAVFSA